MGKSQIPIANEGFKVFNKVSDAEWYAIAPYV
jgi:hypothetical protein